MTARKHIASIISGAPHAGEFCNILDASETFYPLAKCDLLFDAPLKTSVEPRAAVNDAVTLPTPADSGSPRYSEDHQGVNRQAPVAAVRFKGARVVSNILSISTRNHASSEDGSLWLPYNGAEVHGSRWSIAAQANSHIHSGIIEIGGELTKGRWFAFRIRLSGPDGARLRLHFSEGGPSYDVLADSAGAPVFAEITLSSQPKWFGIVAQGREKNGITGIMARLREYNEQAVSGIIFHAAQVEEVTDATPLAPGDYVPFGLAAGPLYYGAGADGVRYFTRENANSLNADWTVNESALGAVIPEDTLAGYYAEPGETNYVSNNAFVGAVVGSTSPPTKWSFGNAGVITWKVIGRGTYMGMPYVEFEIHGTNNTGGTIYPNVGGNAVDETPALPGEKWSHRVFFKYVSGSRTAPICEIGIRYENGSNGYVAFHYDQPAETGEWERMEKFSTAPAGTGVSMHFYQFRMNAGESFTNYRFRLAGSMLVNNPVLSSFILTEGVPAARSDDRGLGYHTSNISGVMGSFQAGIQLPVLGGSVRNVLNTDAANSSFSYIGGLGNLASADGTNYNSLFSHPAYTAGDMDTVRMRWDSLNQEMQGGFVDHGNGVPQTLAVAGYPVTELSLSRNSDSPMAIKGVSLWSADKGQAWLTE